MGAQVLVSNICMKLEVGKHNAMVKKKEKAEILS